MGTVPNSGALPTAPVDTAPHLRPPLRVATVLAAVVATLGLATLGTWLGSERSASSQARRNRHTGLRNPVAWNNRFGLNRRARLVERPLTGPDGELDQYGNLVQR